MCANRHVTGALCSVFFVAGNHDLWENRYAINYEDFDVDVN